MGTGHPHPRDIVIRRQVHSPAVYVLSRIDGAPQCFYHTYREALAQATRAARNEQVNAFYSDGEHVLEQVADHRPA
jgi:hypothetical protein